MTTKSFFKSANILHRTFLAGSALFILVAVYMNATSAFNMSSEGNFEQVLMLVTVFMGLWGIFGSLFISKRMMKRAAEEDSLSKKMARYKGVLILRPAITEGAALLGAVAFMLTGNQVCLGIAVICTVFMGFMRPDKEEAKRYLQLSSSEAMMLDQENAEIMDDADWKASRGN